jgi:hypothetical protein
MNKPIAVLLASAVLLAGTVRAQDAQDAQDRAAVAAATESATRWLALVDAGKSGETWEQAAPALQAAVTRKDWSDTADAGRKALGAVKSRKLQAATFTHTLPGAPAGDYVVLQYATEFATRLASSETVVPMKLPDGSWKVSGYFVR